MNPTSLDRHLGCLLGLAAGDALGTTIEFRSPGSFEPVTTITGGGPFHLKAGQWTDDTSMALCLAESLITKKAFDPKDQAERYVAWMTKGHLSATGTCFDIGGTVSRALREFQRTGDPFSGPGGTHDAGNGSIMRLAPVPMAFASDPEMAIHLSGESSRTTHQTPACIDACRHLGGILATLLNGRGRDEVLAPRFHPTRGQWEPGELSPEIERVAEGSFKILQPPFIQGSGYVVKSLEAALWAFHHTENFRDGALLAVNLGDDADTTGAVYGQIAGACYGIEGIPAEWRELIAMRELIENFACKLHQLGNSSSPPAH